ncbi:MAG: GNAT family N-acetyltransferase [Oligoflexia bacterium]|nr:GNAT family N-acetyltransferase [Oligoflexia bacterium]
MVTLRKVLASDYDDIVNIAEGIWDGSDYMPNVFKQWVNDPEGVFICAVDTVKNKVVGTGKLSILYDGSGWLEGFRVHKDYRGQKIGRKIAEYRIDFAKTLYQQKKINKLALATHLCNVESVSLISKLNFKLKSAYYVFWKEPQNIDHNNFKSELKDFEFTNWECSYDEFINLDYIKRRSGLIDLGYVFQQPTLKLYQEIKNSNGFVSINGYKGIFKIKGDAYFIAIDETFEAINTFTNYYLLKLKDGPANSPTTSLTEMDASLIENFNKEKYTSWSNWQPDYFYYVYDGDM